MTSDELDSAFYPPQMERRDWSDSFVYVTTLYETRNVSIGGGQHYSSCSSANGC